MVHSFRSVLLAILCAVLVTAYRDVALEPGKSFPAYDNGFVGQTTDPHNLLRERINEGAHDSTAKPVSQAAVATQICPGMVGPFTGDLYYCTGKEFGYCDRRNGVCFCNVGYTGLDCSQCTPTHFKIGHLCYPKKLCPNNCSGGGECDYYTGKCTCEVGRVGEDCSETLCSSYDPNCEDCTNTHCVRCVSGFSLALGRCEPCHRFDPRCVDCNAQECVACADMVLLSIQRSGPRPMIDPQLPFDEVNRTYSQTFPFGSQDPRFFDEAEPYFVARGPKQPPLNSTTVACEQGRAMDASWACASAPASNIVCGHVGRFIFSSPTYRVSEAEPHVRITVRRSGGGVGEAEVEYALTHITTSASDVGATAAYTTVQTLYFEAGVIEKAFLLPIFDDSEVEGDEVFQLSLRNPSKWSDVGNTREALVTIVDDDSPWHTHAKFSKIVATELTTAAGETVTLEVQAADLAGQRRNTGGDLMYGVLVDEQPLLGYQTARRPVSLFDDVGDGSYLLNVTLTHQGRSTVRAYLLHVGGWRATYFYDSWLASPRYERVDRYVNFTWDEGTIDGYQVDYTSVRWTGVLMTPVASVYTFLLECDDHARLIIDGVVRIDAWDEVVAPVARTFSTSWEADSLHKLELEYRDLQGNARVRLQWQHDGAVNFTDIPSEYVHYEEELAGSPVKISTVAASVTEAPTTECVGEGLYQCTAGKAARFWICPRDRFGNRRTDVDSSFAEQDVFDVRLALDSSSSMLSGDYEVSAVVSYERSLACFKASYVVDKAGIYRLDVALRSTDGSTKTAVYGSPFTVVATPGDAIGTSSLVHRLQNHTVAGVPLSFEIEVRDLHSNVRAQGGDVVEVHAVHSTSKTTEYGEVTDHGNGTYSVSILLPRTGVYELVVEVNSVLVFKSPPRIAVSSNVPHPAASTCSIDPIGRVGFELGARIFLRDEWSNTLTQSSTSYNLSTSLSGKTALLESTPSYFGGGEWSVSFVPADVGANVLVVSVDGVAFCNGTTISQIADGVGSSSESFVYGAGSHSATAGEEASFFIQAVDAQGHPRRDSGDTFNVSIAGPAVVDTLVLYSGNGTYRVTYIPILAGWYNLTVFLVEDGVSTQLPLPPPSRIYVRPSVPIAHSSRILHEDSEVEAGSESRVELHLQDEFGNPLESGGELVQTVWTGSDGLQAVNFAHVADHGDGSYTATWTPTRVDTYTVVTAAAEHALAATYFEANTTERVIRSFVDTAPLQLSPSVLPRTADGTDLSTTEFWARWEGWILPPYRQSFRFSVQVDSYSSAVVRIGDRVLCDTASENANSAVFTFESLEPHKIVVEYRHSQYASLLQILWGSHSFPERALGVDHLRTFQNVSVASTSVYCSSVCAPCTIASGLALERAVAGLPAKFAVDARDRFDNHITDAGYPVNATLVLNGQAHATALGVEEEPGYFTVTYTTHQSGSYLLYVTIGCCAPDPLGDGIAAFLEFAAANGINGSPFTVEIQPNRAVGFQSFAVGEALNSSVAGVNSTFAVYMRDSEGNPTTDYDLQLLDFHTVINGHEYAPVWNFVHADDVVYCTYLIHTAGSYIIQLYYNNSMLASAPHDLLVIPARASAAYTRPYGHHLTVAQVGMPVYFRIETIDEFMNPLTFGGHKFFIRMYGAETIIPHFSDEGAGWYRTNYTIPTHAGIYDVHILLLSSEEGRLQGDGIIAQYFESPVLEGEPVIVRREDRVALSAHGDHAPALPDNARSVRWSGYLYIPVNDLYVFTVETNQRVMFYLDEELLFDTRRRSSEGKTLSPPLRLYGGTSYRIKLEMFTTRNHDPAYIEWYWEAALTMRAPVPRFYLHSHGSPIVGSPYRLTATLPTN